MKPAEVVFNLKYKPKDVHTNMKGEIDNLVAQLQCLERVLDNTPPIRAKTRDTIVNTFNNKKKKLDKLLDEYYKGATDHA